MDISGSGAPPGAILAALDMIEGDGEECTEALLETWGEGYIAQAFGVLIATAMEAVEPSPGEGDRLHLVVPAVVTRLHESGRGRRFLPTMAAVLTAAALGEDVWGWRGLFGCPGPDELVVWRETTRLLADMADTLVYGERGSFGRLVAETVTGAE
jgi:hypothetical protein